MVIPRRPRLATRVDLNIFSVGTNKHKQLDRQLNDQLHNDPALGIPPCLTSTSSTAASWRPITVRSGLLLENRNFLLAGFPSAQGYAPPATHVP